VDYAPEPELGMLPDTLRLLDPKDSFERFQLFISQSTSIYSTHYYALYKFMTDIAVDIPIVTPSNIINSIDHIADNILHNTQI